MESWPRPFGSVVQDTGLDLSVTAPVVYSSCTQVISQDWPWIEML
jgi:hypothetical protein